MKKPLLTALLLTAAGTAMAGAVIHPEVTIDTTARTADGSMVGARNSADSIQDIGCSVFGSTAIAWCTATAESGVGASCFTSDPAQVDMIKALTDESLLYFKWDENGGCVDIFVSTRSIYMD